MLALWQIPISACKIPTWHMAHLAHVEPSSYPWTVTLALTSDVQESKFTKWNVEKSSRTWNFWTVRACAVAMSIRLCSLYWWPTKNNKSRSTDKSGQVPCGLGVLHSDITAHAVHNDQEVIILFRISKSVVGGLIPASDSVQCAIVAAS